MGPNATGPHRHHGADGGGWGAISPVVHRLAESGSLRIGDEQVRLGNVSDACQIEDPVSNPCRSMEGGSVDQLLDVAVERAVLDELEVEVGRTLEDRV
jgi:hypothetical protein